MLRKPWQRYGFAVLATALAAAAPRWTSHAQDLQKTPLLAAFTAVVATAALAGFGPTILAMCLGAAWGISELLRTPGFSQTDITLRIVVFTLEALLVAIYSWGARRIARQIADAAKWHQRLVETAGEGIWVFGLDGRIVWANPRIAELLGYPLEQLQGRLREEFVFPEDSAVERLRLQNLQAGHKEQLDRRLRRADGSEVWLLSSSNPILDERGRFQGVLSMMTDITERKRAETALRHSETRFRSLFENILEGVYQSTPDGRILAANPMLLSMLGFTSETQLNEINIGEDLYVDKSVRQRLLEKLEQEGKFRNEEYELRTRDGRIIRVRENARVVRDEKGKLLYYEGTLADLTNKI